MFSMLKQTARRERSASVAVGERRKPQIKHAITNKDVDFHGNNDINVVIIVYRDGCHEDLDCRLVDPFI